MTTENRSAELEALLVDDGEQAIDSMLRGALDGLVAFTRDGRMVTKPQFLKLSQQSRLLLALLGRHAMLRLKLQGAVLEATTDALEEECLVPKKNCGEYLSRLRARRLVDKNDRGYFIPSWSITTVVEAVKKAG